MSWIAGGYLLGYGIKINEWPVWSMAAAIFLSQAFLIHSKK